MKKQAQKSNNRGKKFLEQGKWAQAEYCFHQAIEVDDDWATPWFNLGLLYKWQNRWRESLHSNLKAIDLGELDSEAWWNVGVAATALAEWGTARLAWQNCNISLPPGDGQPLKEMGLTPIQLDPMGNTEVVWCKRIDPARAIIQNVPLPASNRRYLDLLLHDGEPVGYRELNDKLVPVFNELALIESSKYITYELIVNTPFPEDMPALFDLAPNYQISLDDWSAVRILCRPCIEQKPHDRHETQSPTAGPLYRLGVATLHHDNLDQLIQTWRANRPECVVVRSQCVNPLAGG